MKKLLSFVGLIAIVAIFAYANKTAKPIVDGTYYLFNEETGLYMSRGATWGTACTADYFGVPANLAFTDDNSKIVFYDWAGTGLGANLFTDNGSPATFTFAGSAEEGYTIYCATLEGGAGYVSVDAAGKPLKVEADAANASKWKLVAREDYEKAVADAAAKIKADAFTAAGVDEAKLATDYKLVDVTYLVQSAALKSSYSGWTWTPEPNRGGNLATNENGTECYQGVGVLSQTVSGLQPGLYEVGIQTFYRDGSNANCGTMFDAGYRMVNGYLSANGNKVRFADWASEATDSYSKPNSMPEYKVKADSLGAYKISTFAVVGLDGKLEISLNQPNWINGGWWIFSNVTLTQYAEKGAKITPKFSVKVGTETFAIGETDTITVTSESDGAITFKSLDETVATVADNVATGVAVGTAKIAIAQAETETYVAMADTVEIPVTEFSNITDKYIVNGRFLDGANGWTCSFSPGLANNGHIGALEAYAGYNSIELASFKMTQDIVLPSGQYRLTSNAFYRYGLKYDVDPSISEGYMVCGTNKTKLPTLGSIPGLASYANDMAQALAAFEKGLYSTYTDFKVLEDGTVITVGYEGTFPIKQSWFISGPLKLERTGDVSVEGYIDDLQAALATVPEGMMEKSLRQALTDAATAAQVVLAKYAGDPTSVTAKEANDACEALKIAINNAEPSIKIYKNVKDAADKAQALDEDGQKKFNELIADVQTAYNEGTITDGVAELATINSALIEATKAQTTIGSDWSLLGSNKKEAWFGATGTLQTGVEYYSGDVAAKDTVLLSQTIEGLMPNAKYEVKFYAAANVARTLTEEYYGENIAYVFANNEKQDIVVNHNVAETLVADSLLRTLETVVGADGKLEFGLANKKIGGQWYIAQFVSLKLLDAPQGLSKLIIAGVAGKAAGETLTIDLNKGEEYPLNTISDAGLVNLVINGNGAVVNVSSLGQITGMQGIEINNVNFNCVDATVAPVALSAAPDSAVHASKGDFYGNKQNVYVDTCAIVLNGCNFAQLPTSLVSNNKAAWILGGLTIDNCVIQFCKSNTKPYIDFETAPGNVGAIKNFTINASTLFNDSIDDAHFIKFANASNGQASKAFPADPKEYITFTNNTFVNICTKKNFGNNTQNNNAFVDEIKGNVFFNVYRINKYIQTNNTFNFTVADNAINGDIVTIDGTDKSKIATEDTALVLTLPEGALNFNNIMALKANFAATEGSYAAEMGYGDPRWLPLPPITEARGWKFDNMPTDWAADWAGIIQAANDGNGYWAASSKGRYSYVPALNDEQLTFDGTTVIPAFEGLYFTDASQNGLLVCPANGATYRCAQLQSGFITRIPQVAAGDTIKLVLCNTEKSDIEDGMIFTNALDVEGNAVTFVTTPASTYTEFVFVAAADGDFTFKVARKGVRLQTINVIPEGYVPTGINDVISKVTVPFAEGIFNLRGQKVSKMRAGEIYLINGKKYIAK